MTTAVQDGLDNTTATRGTLRPRAAEGGHEDPPERDFKQPPPPPPPPKRFRWTDQATSIAQRIPARMQLAGGVCILLLGSVAFTRAFVHPVDEDAIVNRSTNAAIDQVAAYVDNRLAGKTQIAVSVPFSWAKCKLSYEAQQMIGGEASTGGKMLNVERATPLDEQTSLLLQSFRMTDLRLVATSKSGLQVVGDQPAAGVRLFDCGADTVETAPKTVVPTPQDAMPPTTAAAAS